MIETKIISVYSIGAVISLVAIISVIIWYFYKKRKKNLFKPKVGLALGSGGMWGLTHIGVLKVLEENNVPIDYIAGCSMGAIIGACYALNPNVKELEEKALDFTEWKLVKLIKINTLKISLISGNKIKDFLKEIIGDKSFSDTKIPLQIIATDLESGEEIVIKKGKLVDAIMASISIPGIFPPVRLQEGLLIDGGVINPTPVNRVKEMGSDVVVGIDLTMKDKIEFKNPNIFQTLMRSYEILRTQSTKFNIDKNDKNLLIIKPNITKLRKFKFHEVKKFIKEGKKVGEEYIPKIKSSLKNFK